jgi:hypothetical protein
MQGSGSKNLRLAASRLDGAQWGRGECGGEEKQRQVRMRRVRGVWGPGRNIYSRRRTTAGQGLDRTATVRRFKRVAGSNGRRFHFFEFHHGERTELPPGVDISVSWVASSLSVLLIDLLLGWLSRRWGRQVGYGGIWAHWSAGVGGIGW